MNNMLADKEREELERVSGIGSWEADVDSGAVRWSALMRAIHDTAPDFAPTIETALAFFPPEGRGRLRAALDRLLAVGEPFDLTLPFVTARGRPRWAQVTGAAFDADGPVTQIYGAFRDVTEQRAERKRLRNLAALAENTTNAVIVTGADGRTEWINAYGEKITGYSLDDLRGRKPGELLQCEETDPETVALVGRKLAAAEPVSVEILNRNKAGRRYWVEMEILPLRDDDGALSGFVAIETDISARKAAEAAQAHAARLGRILELSLNEIFVFDAETLGFIEVNLGARRNLGYFIEELQTMTPVDIKPDVRRPEFDALIAPLRAGETDALTFRTRHQRRDGSNYPAEIDVQLIPGPRPVFVAMAQDMTERDAAQAALVEARERAEEANRAKSAFLATMSHEIRTPMNGVLGMAALLDKTLSDPAQKRMVGVIRDSGELLVQIINDILDLSKIEAGKMRFESGPVDPADIARRIESIYTLKASEKNVSFAARITHEAAATRIGDAHRIAQVLHNLVGNAIKFTERGEVNVEIAGRPPDPLRIVVRDTGIGMTPAEIATVFDAFAQADSSTTRKYGGTGLGMPIVRNLVEGMDGEIAVTSAPGVGTTVTVTLPLPAAGEDETVAPSAEAPQEEVAPLALNVLAADDNAVNRMVLDAMLARLGIRVTMVNDGAEAVAAWRPDAFDALLLDISMPVMDGVSALRAIRAREAEEGCAPIPALAITAHALEHQVRDHLDAGFTAHLSKPLDLDAVDAALRALPRRAIRSAASAPAGAAAKSA
jgi:PAS domain S-box-containing protein